MLRWNDIGLCVASCCSEALAKGKARSGAENLLPRPPGSATSHAQSRMGRADRAAMKGASSLLIPGPRRPNDYICLPQRHSPTQESEGPRGLANDLSQEPTWRETHSRQAEGAFAIGARIRDSSGFRFC